MSLDILSARHIKIEMTTFRVNTLSSFSLIAPLSVTGFRWLPRGFWDGGVRMVFLYGAFGSFLGVAAVSMAVSVVCVVVVDGVWRETRCWNSDLCVNNGYKHTNDMCAHCPLYTDIVCAKIKDT